MNLKYIVTIIICSFLYTQLSSQCVEESHSPFADQGWFSCQKSLSVIPERGEQHWIQYDFNEPYVLLDMQIWNHNVWGQTGAGVKSILIDYSMDQENWSTIGPLEIEKATGSWKYTTEEVFDFEEVVAKHVLITVIDTWDSNSDCAGFGELRIGVDMFVSTNEQALVQNFEVYPNPAIESIKVDLHDIPEVEIIEMSNAVGQVLQTYKNVNNEQLSIDINQLTEGMYFINVYTAEGKVSKSFVKI